LSKGKDLQVSLPEPWPITSAGGLVALAFDWAAVPSVDPPQPVENTARGTMTRKIQTLEIPGASIPVFDRSLGDARERELFLTLSR
jgi:hypothetical protein